MVEEKYGYNTHYKHSCWTYTMCGIFGITSIHGKASSKICKMVGHIWIIIAYVAFGMDWADLYSILAIFAGLIMIVGILPAIPGIGKSLEKLAKWLGGFQGLIGIIILLLGILGFLDILVI